MYLYAQVKVIYSEFTIYLFTIHIWENNQENKEENMKHFTDHTS